MQSHRLASGWWPNRMRAGKETQPMCFHVWGQTIWAFFPELQKSKSPCAPSSWYKFSMGTGCILAAAGSHPLQMLLKLVQWWLLIHPVIHYCVGSTCVQMPSDSTPKYHSSPCTCFLMNADKMFLSGMRCRGASPLSPASRSSICTSLSTGSSTISQLMMKYGRKKCIIKNAERGALVTTSAWETSGHGK